jgi:energy-coupling factor transporter ATP-binding protein EcfA2
MTEGEFIVVTGPEGSGKSTLVELLAGLSEPTSGYALWNGTPLSRLRSSERVRCVGLVYQEVQQQLLGESVAEEIKLGLEARNLGHAQSEQRARWTCEAVGLDWELMKERPSHLLSGGEQARLAIAAVVALEPQVLILDETLSSLDPAGQAEVLSLLRELHAGGTAVLLVASEDYSRTGTRLWKLDRGRLIYDGPPERE